MGAVRHLPWLTLLALLALGQACATKSAPAAATREPATPTPPTPSPTVAAAELATSTATTLVAAPSPPPAATSAAGGGSGGVIELRAVNLAFSPGTITVRSGQAVVVNFVNADLSVAHDVAFRVPGATPGGQCTGPCFYTLRFVAPAPGNYQFVCLVHESSGMEGTLRVTP